MTKKTTLERSSYDLQKVVLAQIVKYQKFTSPKEVKDAFVYYWQRFFDEAQDGYFVTDRNKITKFDDRLSSPRPILEAHSTTKESYLDCVLFCFNLALKNYGNKSPKIVAQYCDCFIEILIELLDSPENFLLDSKFVEQREYYEEGESKSDLDDVTKTTIQENVKKKIRSTD